MGKKAGSVADLKERPSKGGERGVGTWATAPREGKKEAVFNDNALETAVLFQPSTINRKRGWFVNLSARSPFPNEIRDYSLWRN